MLSTKSGLFSSLLPERKNSGSTRNIRDSMESTKDYDVEFIKNFIEDGKHTLEPTPYNESDLAFTKIVCPTSEKLAKLKQMAQTSDKMVQTSDKKVRFNLAESEDIIQTMGREKNSAVNEKIAEYKELAQKAQTSERIASDKIAEYKQIAQTSENLLKDKIAEYEQMAQTSDKLATEKILEYMQMAQKSEKLASEKIAEYKQIAETTKQIANDKIALFKQATLGSSEDVTLYKRMAIEANNKIAEYKRMLLEANNKITEYKRMSLETSDQIANNKITEYKRMSLETSDQIAKSESLGLQKLIDMERAKLIDFYSKIKEKHDYFDSITEAGTNPVINEEAENVLLELAEQMSEKGGQLNRSVEPLQEVMNS